MPPERVEERKPPLKRNILIRDWSSRCTHKLRLRLHDTTRRFGGMQDAPAAKARRCATQPGPATPQICL
jgi:hypothetical protein